MNKEQILRDKISEHNLSLRWVEGGILETAILEAMEEYRNQPPKIAGVKSPEQYLKEAWEDERKADKSVYTRAVEAMLKDFEKEMERLLEFVNTAVANDIEQDLKDQFGEGIRVQVNVATPQEILTQFRNQKPRG
jgi:predicted phage-related endonuclease